MTDPLTRLTEVAARAIHESKWVAGVSDTLRLWHRTDEREKDEARKQARAALRAALPVLADALRERQTRNGTLAKDFGDEKWRRDWTIRARGVGDAAAALEEWDRLHRDDPDAAADVLAALGLTEEPA